MLRNLAKLVLPVAVLVASAQSAAGEVLEAGTCLEARLSVATGSRVSHAGDPIEATVIAPVFLNGRLLIPQGALVSGVVEKVERLGLGLKHLTAGIEYRFDAIQLPDGEVVPIEAHVAQVETAKERVNAQGFIGGIYPTANLSSSVAFYLLPLLCIDPEFGVPVLGIKFLIARSPDPEIYFPAGTEVILRLAADASIPHPGIPQDPISPLPAAEISDARAILAQLPEQRTSNGGRPSDLVNVLFLGAKEPIDRAFQAAGWSGAQRRSVLSLYRMYHCMVQRMGYRMAPMGRLTLNGATADAEYQKSLDTFSRRHHLRLWEQRENVWLGAATEDIGYTVRKMHVTHATDPFIDNERTKVLNDLAFTGCVESASLITRGSGEAATQDRFAGTDDRVVVIRMNDCSDPRAMPSQSATSGPRAEKRSVQALIALRNDLIRSNPITLASNTVRALQEKEKLQVNSAPSGSNAKAELAVPGRFPVQPWWIRPSVLDESILTIDAHR